MGRRLIFREDLREKIAGRHAALQKTMPRHLETQAVVPHGALIVDNPVGTAPGLILEHEKGFIISLPGVPHEMVAMFRETVFEFIRKAAGGYGAIRLRVLRTFGLMEPQVNDLIVDMMGTGKEPYIGLTAKETGVDVRINAFGKDEEGASRLIHATENRVRSRLGNAIYGVDRQTMEEVVGGLLREKGFRISVAESCTGGLIGHRLTNVPGSSDYFEEGVVCYSNPSKWERLRVPPEVIQKHGSVSALTAKAMADGMRQVSRTDLSLAVTGIAGPDGGTPEKPVGTVYIALATPKGTDGEEYRLTGTREVIKLKASQHALNMVRRFMLGK
jgi:nicotinamide-nucleotide amidase